jgi:hypothetical protein
VLLVQTPYGKSLSGGAMAAQQAGGLSAGLSSYLVERGYLNVVADVRGTGDSGGSWGLFDPVQQQDGATLVRWAAALPRSDGRVGTYGPSYLGIDQLATANALGPGSPLKAMFPIVAGNDLYRDTAFMGGMSDIEFSLPYMLMTGGLHSVDALLENPQDPAGSLGVLAQHSQGLLSLQARLALSTLTGGEEAYDGTYWQERRPQAWLRHIAALGIPTFLVGGWFDLFQRGEPLNYSGLQNAAAGRPVDAPMLATQAVSSRYQLLMGPWYHLDAGTGVDLARLELQWFDRWLKGVDTGIDTTSTPLHLYQLGSNRWVDTSRYPLDGLTPTTLYLGPRGTGGGAPSANDGGLTTTPPAATAAADETIWTPISNPCGRQSEQWSAGAATAVLHALHAPGNPCASDDRLTQSGPGALTYTTAPFAQDMVLGGPIDATVFATSTRPEVELEATVEDVAPSGASLPLTSGALLGSFRALDPARTWYAPDGRPLLPYHPYTRASARPVATGAVTRYDIEVFPAFARLAAGHRLRLTLNTSDTPHLLPTAHQLLGLAGGVYEVQRSAAAASFLEVPLAPASRMGG